jgi:catalase
MRVVDLLSSLGGFVGVASAACPVLTGELNGVNPHGVERRQSSENASQQSEQFLSQFFLDDNNTFLTTDVGGPISDQTSLKGGIRGPTLLEDFIFRQKIQHFDHERVCI